MEVFMTITLRIQTNKIKLQTVLQQNTKKRETNFFFLRDETIKLLN